MIAVRDVPSVERASNRPVLHQQKIDKGTGSINSIQVSVNAVNTPLKNGKLNRDLISHSKIVPESMMEMQYEDEEDE